VAETLPSAGPWGRATPLPPLGRWALRVDPAHAEGLSPWGLVLPAAMLASTDSGAHAALHLAPDEWLLLAADGKPPSLESTPPHALVDVSDRQLGVLLEGPGVRTLLAAGCPLDLDDSHMPPGFATRTLFGKAEVLLWRRADAPDGSPRFQLEAWRSFWPYVSALLSDAAAG
jgi:sarcosine oxidase subunit gamma